MVLGVAGGVPEGAGWLVVEGHQGGYAAGAAAAQVLLAGSRQGEADALPPVTLSNGEAVHVSSPSIPGGDQGAGDLVAALGDEEGGRGILDQAFDVIQAVRRAGVIAARLGPELEDCLRVLMPAPAYRDSLAGQVGSMAKGDAITKPDPPADQRRRVNPGEMRNAFSADSVCAVVGALDRQRAE